MTSMTLLIYNACYSWGMSGMTHLLWCSYESNQGILFFFFFKDMAMSRNVGWLFRWGNLLVLKEMCFPWLRLWARFSGERGSAGFNVRAKLLNRSYSWNERGEVFSLSDRLSELTYCIHFGTLMAKGMLPAETTSLNFLFFGKKI